MNAGLPRAPSPLALVRRGRTVSTAVVNAWQAMADDAEARADRARLAPGTHSDTDDNWLDAISIDECWDLLQTAKIGRIGFTAHSGYPVVLPVNYSVVDHRVFLRTGRGPKLEAARRGDLVAFEVDDIDIELRTGWSVSITGAARWIRESCELAAVQGLVAHAWAAGPRDELVVIEPVHVGGRRLCASR